MERLFGICLLPTFFSFVFFLLRADRSHLRFQGTTVGQGAESPAPTHSTHRHPFPSVGGENIPRDCQMSFRDHSYLPLKYEDTEILNMALKFLASFILLVLADLVGVGALALTIW